MNKERTFLIVLVLTATIFRALFIWIGRPEFVGWFNHTYYYYVQVRGLLEQGVLPFPDMPLLFYGYALTAKILTWIGMEIDLAIVVSTRFWMSLIPSLIPVPVYFTIKGIGGRSQISNRLWVLVAASAFLPLSLSHIPEFLQKSALGFLLLAVLLFLFYKIIEVYNLKRALSILGVFVLIVATHFGTTAVAVLFGISVLIAFFIFKPKLQFPKRSRLIITSAVLIAGGGIYLFDAKRFARIFIYAKTSLESSFLGALVRPEYDVNQKIAAAAIIVIPLVLFYLLYHLYYRNRSRLSRHDQLFWLSNILFACLLILPVYDQRLFARFALYLSLPAIFILTYIIQYANYRAWLKNSILTLVALGVILLAAGEWMSLQFHNRNKEAAFRELMQVQDQEAFQANDLIITKNGAEHICNWFLGTKSGLITSLNRQDFQKYDRIYILNPIEGSLNFQGLENKDASSEADRYTFMLRNIPKPAKAKIRYESKHIQLLLLDAPPEEWQWDHNGNWMAYAKGGAQ